MSEKIIKLFLLVLLLLNTVSCGVSETKDISTGELKKRINEDAGLLIVDNRSEYEYRHGHIPKAINIPQDKIRLLGTLLPKEKDTPLVFYCRGTS
jgi:phage shock protein E